MLLTVSSSPTSVQRNLRSTTIHLDPELEDISTLEENSSSYLLSEVSSIVYIVEFKLSIDLHPTNPSI